MLAQHVETTAACDGRILRALGSRIDGSAAFEHFETIGGDENAARRLVKTMVGTTDPLHQARRAFRRPYINDEIDGAPVDAEVERRGADHATQTAGGHGVFDAAALARIERTVMQSDRQRVLVDVPELLKDCLGLRARIDEDQRHVRRLDGSIDFGDRMARAVACPRQISACVQNGKIGLSARRGLHQRGHPRLRPVLADEKAPQFVGIAHRRREADRCRRGRQAAQARQAKREKIAPLRRDDRVQFVEHHAAQSCEKRRRIGAGDQQRELLRRREQYIRRRTALALALRRRRVAGAGLDAHAELHFGGGDFEVSGHVHGKRFEWRNIERVERRTAIAPSFGELDERRQKAREGLAGARRRDQKRALPFLGTGKKRELMGARPPAACGKPGSEGLGKLGSITKEGQKAYLTTFGNR